MGNFDSGFIYALGTVKHKMKLTAETQRTQRNAEEERRGNIVRHEAQGIILWIQSPVDPTMGEENQTCRGQ